MLAGVTVVAVSATRASADYVVHDLYQLDASGGPSSTSPQGAVDGQVAGDGGGPFSFHALLWSSAAPPVSLDDSPYSASAANAIGGNQVVGFGNANMAASLVHATLWSGPSHTLTDLNPGQLGVVSSQATATSGAEQVGYGNASNAQPHALLWHNTAASAVDLHPAGFDSSQALGTDGVHQVGQGTIDNPPSGHALLWTGTATSMVDLNPAGYGTTAVGVSGNEQVGYGARTADTSNHALLWHGTADSLINLHPTALAAAASYAIATNGTQQVGYITTDGSPYTRAVVWSGSADSAVDLETLLPANFYNSSALSIDAAGNIFGVALADNGADWHAVEWTPTSTPEPTSLAFVGIGIALILRRARS
jgi:hypothetical protein